MKQRIRRTPACFAGEEEAHLEKMLKARVIQESPSALTSATVLIRKRDGTVRWCIDYHALNEVTVKDNFPLLLLDDFGYHFWQHMVLKARCQLSILASENTRRQPEEDCLYHQVWSVQAR